MKVCIAVLDSSGYSMTFVRKHEERLFPAELTHIFSGGIPPRMFDGELVIPFMDWPSRIIRHFRRLFGRETRYRPQEVARLLKLKKIDVVLAEFGGMGVAMVDACALANVPLVVHFHGIDAYGDDELGINEDRYREMFPRCARVIGVSNHMMNQLKDLGCPDDKLVANPYGVDIDFFNGANPAANAPVFLTVGRFVEKKGPSYTILAFSKVAAKFPDARLKMIGDGPRLDEARSICRFLRLEDRVSFLGVMGAGEVLEEMRHARAFVQHSLRAFNGDCEGTPNSVIEAASCGLPVVATKHCGITEAVVDGETGILVDEGDIEGMADGMLRIAEDVELAGKMGLAAREHVCANYSDELSLNRLRNIIREVVNEG